MLDTLTSHNYRDFGARYAGTFGWLLSDTGRKLVYVNRIADDKVYFTIGTDYEYHANMNSGVMFEFIPINFGWFNADNNQTWFLSRVPVRQWKRGIATSNTAMMLGSNMQTHNVSYDRLARIFNDKFEERNYPKTIGQGAWSKHFAALPHGLYFYDQHIGTYDQNNKTIVLSNPIVKQELTDLITRNGWNISITQAESA